MAAEGGFYHVPVLVDEVVAWLAPALAGKTLVDATVGGGGHAEALLEAVPELRLVGIDRDDEALHAARRRLERFGSRVRLVKANFAGLAEVMGSEEIAGVIYDLGVSSAHLDQPERGFGYRSDAPLDMRMDRSASLSAEEVVNTYSESRIAEVLVTYGEERFARRIARAIVDRRKLRPFRNTVDLAGVVRSAIPAPARRRGPHPARKTFQALRIEVNREMDAIEQSLPAAISGIAAGGRIAAISYHSLEDRIVKRIFVREAHGCRCPSDLPVCVCGRKAKLRVLTKKPVRASPEEVQANPRARSAKLRVAQKLHEPQEAA